MIIIVFKHNAIFSENWSQITCDVKKMLIAFKHIR